MVGVATLLAGAVVIAPAAALTVRPGDIFVADPGDPSVTSGGLVQVDPVSGAATRIRHGAKAISQIGVAVEQDRDILVAESGGFGYSALLRIDATTGDWTTVSGGLWSSTMRSTGIAVERDGDILVTGAGVMRVDPRTGAQTMLSSGGLFVDTAGIALEADGSILVADAGPWDRGAGAVIRVDPVSGAQTRVYSGGLLVRPYAVAVERDGKILVADPDALDGAGAVIRIDSATGAQRTVSSGGSFRDPVGIVLESNGDILVLDRSAFRHGEGLSTYRGAVIRVDPVTGAQATVSAGSFAFVNPSAIAVVPKTNQPPDCSSVTANPNTILRATRGKLQTITLSGASDPDGDAVSFRIDSVQQDEPVARPGIGDNTFPDAQRLDGNVNASDLRVRAERNPMGNGRVYRIAYTASDGTASCSGIANVSVPRKKHEDAVDGGDTTRWDSFTGARVFP